MSDDQPYKIGKGRPPLHTRFKKGAPSPNPNGRPKGSKNTATLVREVLLQKVPLRENGRARNVTKIELGLIQLANKAANGDLKAIQLVINLYRDIEAQASDKAEAKPLGPADREILEMLLGRFRAAGTGTNRG